MFKQTRGRERERANFACVQTFAEYRFEKESGPMHAKTYTVRLHLGEKDYVGTERSLRMAQHAAARLALDDHRSPSLTHSHEQDLPQVHGKFNTPLVERKPHISALLVRHSPIAALNAWSIRNQVPIRYVLLKEQLLSTAPNRSHLLVFYRLYLGHELYFDGHGPTHQQARINCALNAFYFLRQPPASPPSTPQLNVPTGKGRSSAKSEISMMYERARHLALPVRLELLDQFTVVYHIGEKYSATGQSCSIQAAKQAAAEKMLKVLPAVHTPQTVNPITRIYQLGQARQAKVEYVEVDGRETFTYQLKFGENELAEGKGKTKQLAKRAAAEALLDKLDPVVALPPPPAKGLLKRDGNTDASTKSEKKHVHFVEEVIQKDEQSSPRPTCASVSFSIKQQLIEACRKLQIHVEYLDEMVRTRSSDGSHALLVLLSLSP